MNILFLFVSLPHLSNDSSIFTSLIHEFKNQGHKVFVSSKGKGIDQTRVELEADIPVLRIKCPDFTGVASNIKKALAYQQYVLKQRYYVKKFWGKEKIDVIISHSLPPELGYIVKGLKRYFKCKFFLEVPDFTWQDAVAYGYFKKNGPIGMYYRFWERLMFKQADYIGVPTQGNVPFIHRYYPWIDEKKFSIFPFWQKPIELQKNDSIRTELGLQDKFIVIYGGSVGAAQRIEHIIELAEACREVEDMVFLILGRGSYLPVIKQMAEDKGLHNVVFKDFIPQEQYLQLLGTCDVGLIVLNEKMATPNFPSKSLSYFNLKVPVLAALDHVTDFGDMMTENEVGLWAYSDDIPSLKDKLMEYYNSKELRQTTADNAYSLFMETMTPKYAYSMIIKQIQA
jgi:glycosyltransferase involved in cell wall biosynthesis